MLRDAETVRLLPHVNALLQDFSQRNGQAGKVPPKPHVHCCPPARRPSETRLMPPYCFPAVKFPPVRSVPPQYLALRQSADNVRPVRGSAAHLARKDTANRAANAPPPIPALRPVCITGKLPPYPVRRHFDNTAPNNIAPADGWRQPLFLPNTMPYRFYRFH